MLKFIGCEFSAAAMTPVDFVYIQILMSILKKTRTNFLFLFTKIQLHLSLASGKFSLRS